VTNDLRYPAEGFSRDNRQMQIPALFGHQGFSLNYAYESCFFSRDRLAFSETGRISSSARTTATPRRFHWSASSRTGNTRCTTSRILAQREASTLQ
jgi:hypothetical protein